MERNVVFGGLLVSVSLMLSLTLNNYASREALPVGAPGAGSAAEVAAIEEQHSLSTAAPEVENTARDPERAAAAEAARDVHEPLAR